jgi:hypothetical protein
MVPVPPAEVQEQMCEAYARSQQEIVHLQREAIALQEKTYATSVQAVDAVAAAFTKLGKVDENGRRRVAL